MTGGELWRPVVGLEGYIEVSNLGRLRSLDRTTEVRASRRTASYKRNHVGKILTPAKHPSGYLYLTLCGGGKTRRNTKLHHLVLESFVGPRPPGMEGCHQNDIKDDNRLENLRWDTHVSNFQDAIANGRVKPKTHCPQEHEYTPENTIILKNPMGAKRCRKCARERYYKPRARTYPYTKAACR